MKCCGWSLFVRWRLPPSAAIVTQLVTRSSFVGGHYWLVSIPIRFFSAADADAAQCLDRDRASAFETTMRDRFLPSSALAEWESILTGRPPEGIAQPRIVADDRPRSSSSKIFAAPPRLRAALAIADRATIIAAAHQSVNQYGERYGHFEPGEVSLILNEPCGLAKAADAEGEGVYVWCADGVTGTAAADEREFASHLSGLAPESPTF